MTVNPRRPIAVRGATSLGNVQPVRGTASDKNNAGKSGEQMTAEMAALRDQQPMLTTCAWCPAMFDGSTGDGRIWFRAHLADRHPEVKVKRRGRSRSGWKKSSAEDRADAMVAVEARKAMLA